MTWRDLLAEYRGLWVLFTAILLGIGYAAVFLLPDLLLASINKRTAYDAGLLIGAVYGVIGMHVLDLFVIPAIEARTKQ